MRLLILASLTLHLLVIGYISLKSIDLLNNPSLLVVSLIEHLLALLAFYTVCKVRHNELVQITNLLNYYAKNSHKIAFLLALVAPYVLYSSYSSLNIIISQGAMRETLVFDLNTRDLVLTFIIPTIIFSASFFVSTPHNLGKTVLTIALLAASMTIALSRSELLHFAFLSLILLSLQKTSFQQYTRIATLSSLVVISATVFTVVMQRRPVAEGGEALLTIIDTFFRYRAYSFHMADFLIQSEASATQLAYPFFGYLSEKPLTHLFETPQPINTEFVTQFRKFGTIPNGDSWQANVVYPWWVWFLDAYHYPGLFIKILFQSSILALTLRTRFLFSFLSISYIILFASSATHPLMTISSIAFFLIAPIILDLIIRIRTKKSFQKPQKTQNF